MAVNLSSLPMRRYRTAMVPFNLETAVETMLCRQVAVVHRYAGFAVFIPLIRLRVVMKGSFALR
jgi:hypothetical protein